MSNVLFIGSSIYASGAEGHTRSLAKRWSAEHNVFCAVPWTKANTAWRESMKDCCELIDASVLAESIEGCYQRPHWLLLCKQIVWTMWLLMRIKPNLVFFWLHLPLACLGPLLAATISRVPVVVLYHLVPAHLGVGDKRKRLGAWMLNRHVAWIVVSKANRTLLAESYGVSDESITCIYNGVKTQDGVSVSDDKIEQERAQLGIRKNDVLFLYVGNLHTAKGCRVLVQAAAGLHVVCPGAHVLFIGEGPDETCLRRMVSERGADSFIHIIGRRDEIESSFAAADVFVLPSHAEGFSLVLLEAMQAGLPAIVTDASSMPEAVRSREEGLLFRKGDSASLLVAMWHMMDESFRKQCGQRAVRRAKRFDANRMDLEYDKLMSAYCTKKQED